MEVKLGLAQIRHLKDVAPLSQVERYCADAVSQGVDILVFPEALMTPFGLSAEEFASRAQSIGGEFASAVNALAAKHGMWIVYTINEKNPAGRPFNTAVIVGPDGVRRRMYRKAHLFDSGSVKESAKTSSGDKLMEPVSSPFGKLGVAICYDLRFPEVVRDAALKGADFMFFPAAWYDGESKLDHWRGLLIARAIENEMFVAGVCRSDKHCVGHSMVVAPTGEVLVEADREDQLLVCTVDTDVLAGTRSSIPVMDHRRPELYTSIGQN